MGAPGGSAPSGGDADPERPLKLGGFASKFGAAFCYMPICGCLGPLYCIVALAAEDKQNKFVRFHAVQALMVWVLLIVFEIVFYALQFILGMILIAARLHEIMSILGIIFMLIMGVVGLVFFAALVAGLVLSFMGKAYKFPVLGNFAGKQAGL